MPKVRRKKDGSKRLPINILKDGSIFIGIG
jgi:hypothetical protein